MKIYNYSELKPGKTKELVKRPKQDFEDIAPAVREITSRVKREGLKAALEYAVKFDGFNPDDNVKVTEDEIADAKKRLSPEEKDPVNSAYINITKFHKEQLPHPYSVETAPGVTCSREFRAIDNVGLYIPAGTAPLPSTVLMLGVPAKIAGCPRKFLITPAKNGKVNDYILYAASLCDITEIYKIGGAQGIALAAYGDETILPADKIFGPGNRYVTAAKAFVSSDPEGCAIDMPAGPSEVLIIADEQAKPEYVAADLLSQAEHGEDSQVVLIATGADILNKMLIETKEQLQALPRKEIAAQALQKSFALIVNSVEEALSFSNRYAPEHLILNVTNAESYTSLVRNAGSVFLGNFTPESAGDYASGTNHSLPTYGFAKSYSGVSVESFMKAVTFQHISRPGLFNLRDTVVKLAEAEGLEAHSNAVKIRTPYENK